MDMTRQIEAVLDEKVRPMLRSHGGEVRLTGCQNGAVFIELLGACSGCPSADLSTKGFIEETLRAELPGIDHVEVEHPTDSELLEFARALLYGKES